MSYYETLYGEIVDWAALVKRIKDNSSFSLINAHFYDFGSGYGNLIARLSKFVKQSVGVEIVKERHEQAIQNYQNQCPNAQFILGNFFQVSLKSPCILLLNNLCFGTGTNKRLSNKIKKELQKNDIIIVTKKIPDLESYLRNQYEISCSWGKSEIYIYSFDPFLKK